ncbi:MAG: metal-dependent hydrolase [Proteobacteria bacterium]|nr:metal-dependent hydrolase [Pseudomonadota bacterium]
MDTLTHALSGALLARATASKDALPRSLPRRMAAGFLACAAPDLDFVIGFIGPVEYLLHHRGATHSLLLLPAWALVLSWLLAKLLREPGGWRAFYGVCALSLGAHIAGDLITSFGTMVFAPFSDWRAAIGTTFIIDLWFSGIILLGLVASVVLRRSQLPARLALAVLAGYVGFQWTLKQEALEFATAQARALGMTEARIEAYPRAVTPFNWTVYLSDDSMHRFAHVNLRREAVRELRPGDSFIARLDAAFRPVGEARWETRSRYGETPQTMALARAAWDSPGLAFYRWFAGMPAFDGITAGSTCVWFIDLRFVNPGSERVPFRYGACRDSADGPWKAMPRPATSVARPS